MAFPYDLLVPKIKKDGGKFVTETKDIDPTTHKIILSNYARGREILSDGRVLSSSIRVTKGGIIYTEIFDTPVPDGPYFYHYEDTSLNVDSSVLLFGQHESGTVTISYETRGDYILAERHNLIESDLAAIEKLLSSNGAGFKGILVGSIPDSSWTNYIINAGPSVYGKIIDVSAYTNNAATAIVQITLGFNSDTSTNLPTSPVFSITGAKIDSGRFLTSSEILIATSEQPGSTTGTKFLNYTIIIP